MGKQLGVSGHGGLILRERENKLFTGWRDRGTITYNCKFYELQVLKFYETMIIKQVIDFSLQINSLISVLGMKNSGWLLQVTAKLMYTLQNLNKASSLLHAKNLLFCHKIGTLISWEFIKDIFKIQQMVKRCVNSHSCFNSFFILAAMHYYFN